LLIIYYQPIAYFFTLTQHNAAAKMTWLICAQPSWYPLGLFQFPADYEVWGSIVKKTPSAGSGAETRLKTVLVHFSLKEHMTASVWSMESQLIMSLYYSILASLINEWYREPWS